MPNLDHKRGSVIRDLSDHCTVHNTWTMISAVPLLTTFTNYFTANGSDVILIFCCGCPMIDIRAYQSASRKYTVTGGRYGVRTRGFYRDKVAL